MSEAGRSAAVPGIDPVALDAWFSDHVEGARPPLRFEIITGGRSNITYRVVDAAGNRYVLRRPPLGHVLATAHDMGREHRIISARRRPRRCPCRRRSACAPTRT